MQSVYKQAMLSQRKEAIPCLALGDCTKAGGSSMVSMAIRVTRGAPADTVVTSSVSPPPPQQHWPALLAAVLLSRQIVSASSALPLLLCIAVDMLC